MKRSSLWLIVLGLFFVTSCGNKDENSNDNSVVVFCIVKRSQDSTKCDPVTVSDPSYRANEICQIGLEYNGQSSPARGKPVILKSSVDSGQLILKSKESGKKLSFKQETSASSGNFLILQQEGDSNSSSSVNLPFCPDVGV